jgi:GTP-binding protein Era
VEISALKNQGLETLLSLLLSLAPAGEPFYPSDYYTDQEVSFRIAEIIREKAISRLREELPHSIYVDVADMEFRGPRGVDGAGSAGGDSNAADSSNAVEGGDGPGTAAGNTDAAPSGDSNAVDGIVASGPGSPRQRLWVRAFIVTERESQKGMVVGKGGQMIKAIRLAAQKDLDRIFDWKIDLDLRVKTAKDWRHNDTLLKRLIDR